MNLCTFCREITKETAMRMRKVQELLDPEWQPVVGKVGQSAHFMKQFTVHNSTMNE